MACQHKGCCLLKIFTNIHKYCLSEDILVRKVIKYLQVMGRAQILIMKVERERRTGARIIWIQETQNGSGSTRNVWDSL